MGSHPALILVDSLAQEFESDHTVPLNRVQELENLLSFFSTQGIHVERRSPILPGSVASTWESTKIILKRQGEELSIGGSSGESPEFQALAVFEAFEKLLIRDFLLQAIADPTREELAGRPEIRFEDLNWAPKKNQNIEKKPSHSHGGMPAYRFKTKQTVLVRQPIVTGDGIHIPDTRTGFASHQNFKRAAQSAALEVIEHDSLMRSWVAQTPLAPIKIELDLLRVVTQLVSPFRFKCRLFGIKNQTLTPVVLCLIEGPLFRENVGFKGSAAGATLTQACEHALREAMMNWTFGYFGILNLCEETGARLDRGFSEVHRPFYIASRDSELRTFLNSATDPFPTAELATIDDPSAIYSTYDFLFFPLGMPNSEHTLPVAVKAFSPNAIPYSKGSVPNFMPRNAFRTNITCGSSHPF
jgi:hypothetical protein